MGGGRQGNSVVRDRCCLLSRITSPYSTPGSPLIIFGKKNCDYFPFQIQTVKKIYMKTEISRYDNVRQIKAAPSPAIEMPVPICVLLLTLDRGLVHKTALVL